MKKKGTSILSILLALILVLFFGGTGGEEAAAPQQIQTEIVQMAVEEQPLAEEADIPAPEAEEAEAEPEPETIAQDGFYTTKDDVAAYIYTYGRLPGNFMTKDEASALGWEGGGLENFAPGMCIGGDRFGNYEGLLPKASGRKYTECDIDTMGADSRGPKRIVFSNDGLIYYTEDHYESFELLYGEP